ncbi:MAG TPA: aminotransferase class V-fold PLP-dependent enzyme, partial [Pseudacidobacterium sp.]|nr:aminotransferase class V-fold PLP-dependent enzyme [Pseudacidobacterium sp.]
MSSVLSSSKLTRRHLIKGSSLLGATCALSGAVPGSLHAEEFRPYVNEEQDSNIYESIGVRPIINCRGTFTIISGSLTLPEVKRAMDEASRYYVHLDELMLAVGAELAKITGAEWGVVTTGCAAAIANATAACIAGTDPEKSQKLPYIQNLKNQVIIPKTSRNPYDVGTRMLGVEIVEVDTPEELESKLNPRTAMIYIMSSPANASGPMSIENICKIARTKDVPVFVDAAAEMLTIPNIHLQHGATFVGYSGGKCLRGPQSAGLLLGRKDLVQAAWFQAAPHHNYGRALKVGKEEVMGMLTAVRMWTKRDHQAEWNTWMSWLQPIENKVKPLPSVRTEYIQPEDLSNHAPELRIHWDASVLKITGTELEEKLDKGTPRIMVGGARGNRPDKMDSSLTIMPYMMRPEDHPIVADAIYQALTNPGNYQDPAIPSGTPAALAGKWNVSLAYTCGTGQQTFVIQQNGNDLSGDHVGEIYNSPLKGKVHADQVLLTSAMP